MKARASNSSFSIARASNSSSSIALAFNSSIAPPPGAFSPGLAPCSASPGNSIKMGGLTSLNIAIKPFVVSSPCGCGCGWTLYIVSHIMFVT